ncbi:MAG: hypothetical protein QOJ45_1164 [Verrucomicrobiota bacterium]|jgi:hypothetical protein
MDAALRNEIQNELGAIGAAAPVLLSQARVEKLYEIFTMSCVLRALRSIGATMQARDSDDRLTANLVFRLAPGLIYNPASAPGFVRVWYENKEYELQNGLRVKGSSRVLHELDVCIIDGPRARSCRQRQVDIDYSAVRFLAECKCYGDTLPLHLGREYLGLGSEFSLRVKTIVSNVESAEIHTLIRRHGGTTNFRLVPTGPGNVNMFIGWLAKELQHAL